MIKSLLFIIYFFYHLFLGFFLFLSCCARGPWAPVGVTTPSCASSSNTHQSLFPKLQEGNHSHDALNPSANFWAAVNLLGLHPAGAEADLDPISRGKNPISRRASIGLLTTGAHVIGKFTTKKTILTCADRKDVFSFIYIV